MDASSEERPLPFRIEQCKESLIARGGLVLPYEMARALKLPRVIDRELPSPGSGHGYKPSRFVMPLILMLHGGGKTLEDLRQIRQDIGLKSILKINEVPSSDAAGDWLRRMGENSLGLKALEQIERIIITFKPLIFNMLLEKENGKIHGKSLLRS